MYIDVLYLGLNNFLYEVLLWEWIWLEQKTIPYFLKIAEHKSRQWGSEVSASGSMDKIVIQALSTKKIWILSWLNGAGNSVINPQRACARGLL